MAASLLRCLAACIAAQAVSRDLAPNRDAAAGATLFVHVVDAETGRPAAGVAVTCVPVATIDAAVELRWCGLEYRFDPIEFDQVAREFGVTRSSDEHGDVAFDGLEGKVHVIAETDDRF